LQKFNITILDRLGNENTFVDIISKMKNDSPNISLVDNFPDEYFFPISIKSPWFVDIDNYLAIGNFPPRLSIK